MTMPLAARTPPPHIDCSLFCPSPPQVDCFVKKCNSYHKNSEMPPHLLDARVGGSTTMEVSAHFLEGGEWCNNLPRAYLLGRWWQPNTAPLNDDTKQHTQHLDDYFSFLKTSGKDLFLCITNIFQNIGFGFSCISGKNFLSFRYLFWNG